MDPACGARAADPESVATTPDTSGQRVRKRPRSEEVAGAPDAPDAWGDPFYELRAPPAPPPPSLIGTGGRSDGWGGRVPRDGCPHCYGRPHPPPLPLLLPAMGAAEPSESSCAGDLAPGRCGLSCAVSLLPPPPPDQHAGGGMTADPEREAALALLGMGSGGGGVAPASAGAYAPAAAALPAPRRPRAGTGDAAPGRKRLLPAAALAVLRAWLWAPENVKFPYPGGE